MNDNPHANGGVVKPWVTFAARSDGVPRSALTGVRNGMPEGGGYVWRPGDARRAARVEAHLARIRAQIGVEIDEARVLGPRRCDGCGYMTNTRGHFLSCRIGGGVAL